LSRVHRFEALGTQLCFMSASFMRAQESGRQLASRTKQDIPRTQQCFENQEAASHRHPLIYNSDAAPPPPEHRDSTFRPASSIYSQPSPNPIHTRFPRDSYATPEYPEEEVSPPSSPEFNGPLKNRYVEHFATLPRACSRTPIQTSTTTQS
jgi:hypothetical protein